MKKNSISVVCMEALLLLLCRTALATTWYVHPDSTLNSIQTALNSCSANDTVMVGPGTYFENVVWPNTQGIHLTSELGPEYTIIDGDSAGSVLTITSLMDSQTIIDGFTIQNGASSFGAGIYCGPNTGLQITNNLIQHNHAGQGGGIFCDSCSTALITHNTIGNNSTTVQGLWWSLGGGICVRQSRAEIEFNNITANVVEASQGFSFGGGIACIDSDSSHISGTSITDNTLVSAHTPFGGGIYCTNSAPIIDSCTICNNTADGICCSQYDGNATIHRCNISNNDGWGVHNFDSNVLVDAEDNWWGDPTGPYHPTLNPGGSGDTVSDYVDFNPWLQNPWGIEEEPIVKPIELRSAVSPTIFRGPLHLPGGKNCRVFDISGRVVGFEKIQPGIYFIEVDGVVTQKVVKVR